MYPLLKAILSGLLVSLVSETARRSPSLGALIASLPLVSVLGMIWLWRDTHEFFNHEWTRIHTNKKVFSPQMNTD